MGLLGCGRMGAAIGGHLLAAGRPLAVYDPVEAAMRPLVEDGAEPCAGPSDVAERADVVLVVVVDDAQAREAVTAALTGAAPETIVAVCASVRPDTCRELAAAGAERGVRVV